MIKKIPYSLVDPGGPGDPVPQEFSGTLLSFFTLFLE